MTPSTKDATSAAPSQTLNVTDSRTGKTAALPVADGAIRANDLKQLSTGADDPGLLSYDPAFLNTASCRSAITFIDGDKGILRYRGYPIEQLAEKATFLEVAWLLRHGELPTQKEYDQWVHDITFHTYVHENIKSFVQGFRYDAHPMSMLCSTVAALSAFYPSAKNIFDPMERDISIVRLLAKIPTLAAFTYRHVKGMPFVYPRQRPPVRRELPLDDRADERAEVRGAPGVREGDSRCSSSCTRTTSRTARRTRCGRWGRRTWIPSPRSRRGSRRSSGRCTAARTSRCCA